jgi:glycosyltransferase involved in cell wall biosynthesis
MYCKDEPLVSIIIPCYNAERWGAEAVQSCLDQTYKTIEIIVVDDGSTDGSLKVLSGFRDKIILETGPNRGGNHARNRGIELSRGDYIQFLDADDYLLPEKIKRQVHFLEETRADVVYGDWRHQFHSPDGTDYLGDVHVSNAQEDVLESLLRNWWVANLAILFKRDLVIQSGGWDEALKAGQDKDFFISVAFAGANIQYQPGCHSIYRRYGAVTVSTSNTLRWLNNHRLILEKIENSLRKSDRLSERYRQALAQSYFTYARNYYDVDRSQYHELMKRVLHLWPQFRPQESRIYNSVQQLGGFAIAERLASCLRRVRAKKK